MKQWDIIKLKKTGKMTTDADDKENPPYADRIKFYLEVYHDYKLHIAQKEVETLDFDMFMDFAYDLSEKAEPFLNICQLDKDDECFNFQKEA